MNEMIRIITADAETFKARFTPAEFVCVAQAAATVGIKLELIDGGLERMSPPMGGHIKMQTGIIAALLKACAGSSDIQAGVEVGVQLDEDSIVTCDVALLAITDFPDRFLTPSEVILAVEVSDATLARDQGPKRVKYAAAGIPEYWVVSIMRSVAHRYREPIDGDYALIDTIRFGEPLAVPGTDATITLS